jgi:hypothetical protein
MRYRALDTNGDMTFGQGGANFLVNSPACVGQAVLTRLKLMQGEWFLDRTVGMAYATQVFVEGGRFTADRAAQAVILGTRGVSDLDAYASAFTSARNWLAAARVNTIYGQTTVATVF